MAFKILFKILFKKHLTFVFLMCAAWCRHHNHTQVLESLAAEAKEFQSVEWLWGGLYGAAPAAGLRIYPHLSHAAPAVGMYLTTIVKTRRSIKASNLMATFFRISFSIMPPIYISLFVWTVQARVKLQKQ